MKEFMLIIRNLRNHDSEWSAEHREHFLKKCESYIGNLKTEGKLVAAQPLVREGKIISGKPGNWNDMPINDTADIQVGYYHILAKDYNEAVDIAKKNPEFEFSGTARIEVRQIKTKEDTTGFVYPEKT